MAPVPRLCQHAPSLPTQELPAVPLSLPTSHALAAAALLLALSPAAQALVVDTGPGADVGGGWSLYDDRPVTSGYQRLAARFTVGAADLITSVQGWMNWDGGALSFAVLTDFQGLPGATLYSVTTALPATAWNTPDWRGVGGLNWSLSAGNYWLVFADQPGGGSGAMPGGAPMPLEAYASSPGVAPGAEWMDAPTLGFGVRINTTPEPPPAIPEPGTLLLWAVGGAALLVRRGARGYCTRL
jgi:hypothetical protein